MAHVIDIDRGVTMRQIVAFDNSNPSKFLPDNAYGGLFVYMYKDDPGIYYDVHGNAVPDALAKRAGFPTDRLSKAKRKKEAMKDFEAKLAKQLADEGDEEEIIAEAGTWKVVSLPAGRAKVVDKETGELVTLIPMPREDAINLLGLLSAEQPAEEAKPAKGK